MNINIIETEDVVAVEVSTWVGQSFFFASGSSKRDPADKQNPEIGLQLALGRAVRQLGREILKSANYLVREEDARAKKQKEASEAAKKLRAERAKQAKKAANPITKDIAKKTTKRTAKASV